MLFKKVYENRHRFEDMVEKNFNSIQGTALRLTHNFDEAQDLVQESLLKAYEAFDKFDGRNFKSWVLRIITNLYINKYNHRQKFGTTSLDREDVPESAAPVKIIPDRILFDNMLGEEVSAALQEISADYRTVIILSDIENLSYLEIAEVLELPIGTVRSRLARGRAQLREMLEKYARRSGYL